MISYYQYTKYFGNMDGPQDNCWINATMPGEEELEFLKNRIGVPVDYINDISDIDERPRIDIDEDWLLIILRIPIENFSPS